jgi:hypothetical protein
MAPDADWHADANSVARKRFMTPEHGTGGHAGSPAGINPLQMELLDAEADDRTRW